LLDVQPFQLAFIDGAHFFRQALKDFINVEAQCGPQSAVLLHDTVPLDETTQRTPRQTKFHTGDVWKTVLCLKHYRPDLDVFTIATPWSGLTVVCGLDPHNRVLAEQYGDAIAQFADLPYSAIADRSDTALNIVPNDWREVEARLKARGIIGDARPVSRVARPGHAANFPAGSIIIDREQPSLNDDDMQVIDRFHDLYYRRWWVRGGDTINLSWFGYQVCKCPLDLWVYQELLVRTRPDLVIETGTLHGGSALFMATVMDMIGHGRVITIDKEHKTDRPVHPRISYWTGSSIDEAIVAEATTAAAGKRAMVALDSNHTAAHVSQEIASYSPLVQVGDYLIVEDTNVNGHPTYPDFGPGPMEAVEKFLATNTDFVVDERCERFLMTLNPRGYLRRVRVTERGQ